VSTPCRLTGRGKSARGTLSLNWPSRDVGSDALTHTRDIPRVMLAFGTRPEAIKMAPIVKALRESDRYQAYVLVTAQHREMLDQVLSLFRIVPDQDLNLMESGQSLDRLTGRTLTGVSEALREVRPDALLVQGDTTTTFASALAAFYEDIPVVHVEAGLRTGEKRSPFPEEMNRVLTSRMARLHLPPTSTSARNLLNEGVAPETICVTGNTVIDALQQTIAMGGAWADPALAILSKAERRTILVTAHRRESWGQPLHDACWAIRDVLDAFEDVQVIFPVHRNPIVRESVAPALAGHPRAHLVEPADYGDFAQLMAAAHIILTDSGGVQEEGPSLGKPVLVLRESTERPEALRAGTAKLVGTSRTRIFAEVSELLNDQSAYLRMAEAVNPYGDGNAAARTLLALDHMLGFGPKPEDFTAVSLGSQSNQLLALSEML
jgi:UDP-N-acetylglucosamine 2-epimerase (non-hydrolysing)